MSHLFDEMIERFKSLQEVDAITLGGSYASGHNDAASDYDVYIYLNRPLTVEKRQDLLSHTCGYMEINNTYWEMEDDCILSDGTYVDIIYRSMTEARQNIYNALEKHQAGCGYTTCICYNIFNSKILHDPDSLYSDLLHQYEIPYPEPLRQNIITINRKLLKGKIPSYYQQIEKAIKRTDLVSINHRVAAFLASYFDILFAFNRQLHPGEKRLASLCCTLCPVLPEDFELNLRDLLSWQDLSQIMPMIDRVITGLDHLLDE